MLLYIMYSWLNRRFFLVLGEGREGGHRKKITFIGGGVVRKNLVTGGSCNFLLTLQKIPPAPPTSSKINGPNYLIITERFVV